MKTWCTYPYSTFPTLVFIGLHLGRSKCTQSLKSQDESNFLNVKNQRYIPKGETSPLKNIFFSMKRLLSTKKNLALKNRASQSSKILQCFFTWGKLSFWGNMKIKKGNLRIFWQNPWILWSYGAPCWKYDARNIVKM